MKRKMKVVSMFVLFFFVAGLSLISLQAESKKLCCVAGTYDGTQISYTKPNCPPPEKEKFEMVIKQGDSCAANVWGTVTDASGVTSNWTGNLSHGIRGCCNLEGKFVTPSGYVVQLKGTLCLKSGKWHGKGTWVELKSPNPCKSGGNWEIAQR